MIKTILLVVGLLFTTLHAQDDGESNYRGGNFNVALGFDNKCMHIKGEKGFENTHFSSNFHLGHCDSYDDSQRYLTEAVLVGAGVSAFSSSVYRDSFFITTGMDVQRAWTHDIINRSNSNSVALRFNVGTGYQIHFRRGYILSFQARLASIVPVTNDASTQELKDAIGSYQTELVPMASLGWRF
jgi:hypothetical protein